MPSLTDWENFYVIVGSSAGALTGLLFVVITLLAGRRQAGARGGLNAFTTPTVVHFGSALVGAALLSAPWPALWQAALVLALGSLGGIGYTAIVLRRIRQMAGYQPVWEDWLWYVVAPLVSYGIAFVAALLLTRAPTPALFGLAAALLLLLVLGIHNAWDLVTYIAIEVVGAPDSQGEQANTPGATGATGATDTRE